MKITDEMIETMGRALYRRSTEKLSNGEFVSTDTWDQLEMPVREWIAGRIRQGLQGVMAMLPTYDMIDRGARALCGFGLPWRLTDGEWRLLKDKAEQIWIQQARTVLEAALGGEQSASNEDLAERMTRVLEESDRLTPQDKARKIVELLREEKAKEEERHER